ncbi:CBS domain-containing protein [Aromatoleum toluclasticum]|uniref:CBS domain-containing protein n=1 Tax=Aromatoleum toluclasticum TaxID=92003 RepID=UPI001D185B19|nr:CBS domain-containing protein [Aromatoleum toluclasticum]MCC4118096.1 CBS domain-containing protein [Aromatoleum toluclasticum]
MLVESVLATKGHDVLTISPDATVYEALLLMAKNNVGCVLVMSKDQIAGIFSERDYARKIILKGKGSKDTPVSEVMTTEVCIVDKGKTLDECMAVMTAKRVRHLPVVEGDKLIGIISIGDTVKSIIDEKEQEIEHMIDFIHGGVTPPGK